MLNATTRAALRTAANRFLTERCTITVDTVSVDSYGGTTRTQTTVASNVPCRLLTAGSAGDAAGMVGSQESMRDTYRIAFKQGTAVAVDQRVTINSITYNVIGLVTALTDEVFELAVVTRQR